MLFLFRGFCSKAFTSIIQAIKGVRFHLFVVYRILSIYLLYIEFYLFSSIKKKIADQIIIGNTFFKFFLCWCVIPGSFLEVNSVVCLMAVAENL